jgi:hypothetical protein
VCGFLTLKPLLIVLAFAVLAAIVERGRTVGNYAGCRHRPCRLLLPQRLFQKIYVGGFSGERAGAVPARISDPDFTLPGRTLPVRAPQARAGKESRHGISRKRQEPTRAPYRALKSHRRPPRAMRKWPSVSRQASPTRARTRARALPSRFTTLPRAKCSRAAERLCKPFLLKNRNGLPARCISSHRKRLLTVRWLADAARAKKRPAKKMPANTAASRKGHVSTQPA